MIAKRLFAATLAVLLPWGQLFAQVPRRDLEASIAQAGQRRLSLERKQVAVEISQDAVINPATADALVITLSLGAKNTFSDNAERVCKAFALADRRFGQAWKLLRSGRHKAAAQAFKPLISTRHTSYLAAAKRFCYAEALAGAGRSQDAVHAYTDLVVDLPDRLSFSSLALLRGARIYERMNRRYYAMVLYRAWVDRFGLLDPKQAKELTARADEVAADYEDPLGTLAGKMSDVAQRLEKTDSGRKTQQKQKEIIALLDDLIATVEECSEGSGGRGRGDPSADLPLPGDDPLERDKPKPRPKEEKPDEDEQYELEDVVVPPSRDREPVDGDSLPIKPDKTRLVIVPPGGGRGGAP